VAIDNGQAAVAYFSMEVGIDPKIPTYSGGLGILAGDVLKTTADMAMPCVGVTLLTRKGYFRQRLDAAGRQQEADETWTVGKHLKPCKPRIKLPVQGRRITVRAWRYEARGLTGAVTPVYFLDTDLPGNTPEHRRLSHHLYGGDWQYRLLQEWILGAGGVKMLRALGYRDVACFHMNEGHAAFLLFELMNEQLKQSRHAAPGKTDCEAVRARCVFTTHTPVPAGHDRFDLKAAQRILGPHPAWRVKKRFERERGVLDMTHLALAFSRYVNGVSRKHGEVSQAMFPHTPIDSITNGVHVPTWTAQPIGALLDRYVPDWRQDNARLRYALAIPARALWRAHQTCKQRLLQQINRRAAVPFNPKVLTLGFARRATAYKRATLVLKDPARLQRIARQAGRLQIVFAGKAHPNDADGKQFIYQINQTGRALGREVSIVYMPNYDIKLAQCLIPGVDLWLNTPEPPSEASGTSGMKAALNGVPCLSVLDGWWIEGCVEGLTGWAVGGQSHARTMHHSDRRHANALYNKLGKILRLYYQDRPAYLQVMRNALALNGAYFNTQRMVQAYQLKAYQ